MNVRITYPGGRIDVFDTSAYVASAPFDGKNMSRISRSASTASRRKAFGWWPTTTEPRQSTREGASGIPAARRLRGWKLLLATADEAKSLCDATIDGEIVVAGICDSVCNMRGFESAALMGVGASNDGVLERIAKLRAFMALELKEETPAIRGYRRKWSNTR